MSKRNIIFYTQNEDYSLRELNLINLFDKLSRDFKTTFLFPNKNKKMKMNNYIILKKNNYFRNLIWNLSQAAAANVLKNKYLSKKLNKTIYKFNMNVDKKRIFYFLNILNFLKLNNFFIKISKFFLKITMSKKKFNFFKKKKLVDLIIIFGSPRMLNAFDLVEYSKNKKIKTIFITGNWDNATKPFFFKPDLTLTWGKQTSDLCKKLNKLNTSPIGTPRFDLLLKSKFLNKNKAKKKLKLNQKIRYLIYAGKLVPSKDFELLNKINSFLSMYKDIKIIYRPHPYAMDNSNLVNFKNFKKKNSLNNIVIDPTLDKFSNLDMKQYLYLFSASHGLVSSFSTLTLESAYYKLPSFCFAINELLSENRFDYEVGCRLAPHLLILNKYSWPHRSFGYKNFFHDFKVFLDNLSPNKKISQKVLHQAVYHDKHDYYTRLYKIIKNF